jgi:F5/8 type C domain
MTTRPGFVRRVLEWFWRSQRLRELKAAPAPARDVTTSKQVWAYRNLSWRTLGGLEPVPAQARALTARPLLLAGIRQLLPLLQPPCPTVDALFEDPTWTRYLENSGVPKDELPQVKAWLTSHAAPSDPHAAERALLLLDELIEASDEQGAAIARVKLWRLGAVTTLLALLGGLVAFVLVVRAPPEGADISINKPWRASSAYVGHTTEGRKPERPTDVMFFCTNEDDSPWWQVDLSTLRTIDRITLVNRGDCCAERATPLAIEVSSDGNSWREVIRRDETFRTWRAKFKPTQARYVRLRALRRTFLHMKDVRIQEYAPKK